MHGNNLTWVYLGGKVFRCIMLLTAPSAVCMVLGCPTMPQGKAAQQQALQEQEKQSCTHLARANSSGVLTR